MPGAPWPALLPSLSLYCLGNRYVSYVSKSSSEEGGRLSSVLVPPNLYRVLIPSFVSFFDRGVRGNFKPPVISPPHTPGLSERKNATSGGEGMPYTVALLERFVQ